MTLSFTSIAQQSVPARLPAVSRLVKYEALKAALGDLAEGDHMRGIALQHVELAQLASQGQKPSKALEHLSAALTILSRSRAVAA